MDMSGMDMAIMDEIYSSCQRRDISSDDPGVRHPWVQPRHLSRCKTCSRVSGPLIRIFCVILWFIGLLASIEALIREIHGVGVFAFISVSKILKKKNKVVRSSLKGHL